MSRCKVGDLVDRPEARAVSAPLFDSQLRELCDALGWQGGTYWQVLEEVRRLAIMREALLDPVLVHAAMLRGEIATPGIRELLHLHGQDALSKWDAA